MIDNAADFFLCVVQVFLCACAVLVSSAHKRFKFLLHIRYSFIWFMVLLCYRGRSFFHAHVDNVSYLLTCSKVVPMWLLVHGSIVLTGLIVVLHMHVLNSWGGTLYIKCLYCTNPCGGASVCTVLCNCCGGAFVCTVLTVVVVQVGMELLVCAVHPIPGEFYFLWTTKLSNHGGKIGSQESTQFNQSGA